MNELENLELKISKFLRAGVIVSGLLMLTGWLMQIELSLDPFLVFKTYDHIPFQDIFALHLKNKQWGYLISYAGLVSLIFLPVIRVLLTAVLFIHQKERLLALIAALVLLGLFISFSFGIEL
jgi:uncharacterized membrane protein